MNPGKVCRTHSPHPPASRRIEFKRLFNVRDLGGLPTSTGRAIRPRRLLRTDDPHLATPSDRSQLRTLSIDVALDLRSPAEVGHRGVDTWTDLDIRRVGTPWWTSVPPMADQQRYLTPASAAQLYGEMHLDSLDNQAHAWATLAAHSEGHTAIHCASGRDRTGILIAILLSALGVPRSLILDDYAYSGVGMGNMLDHLESTHTPQELLALNLDREAAIHTPAETIDKFLDWLHNRHGSIDGYFASLDSTDTLASLRKNLLAD